MFTVLIIEDHKELAATIGEYLEHSGFTPDYALDGLTGLHLSVTNKYDAIILDIMLPGIDGFDICERIRNDAKSDIPILMLTARDQIEDKLKGFEKGTDDYLIKPFDPDELVARLKSLIRRHRGEFNNKILKVGDLSFDPETMIVERNGKILKVSPTGIQILKILMKNSPKVISKNILAKELWGELAPESDVLRSHLYILRKTIDKPFANQLIHTVPSLGIKIEDMNS